MNKLSRHTDLEIEVIFRDDSGAEIPVPAYPFRLRYFTNPLHPAIALQDAEGRLINCAMAGGRLHVYLDKPRFDAGVLRCRHELDIPGGEFPDAVRTIVREGVLDARIVSNPFVYSAKPVIDNIVVTELDRYQEFVAAEDGSLLETEDNCVIQIFEQDGRN